MDTLLEMATSIAEDVGLAGDDETLTKAKSYLQKRLRYLWDLAPWKDSLAMVTLTKNPALTTEPSHILYMPANCDVVMGLRDSTGQVSPFSLEKILIGQPEKFSQTGRAYDFAQLSPAVWTSSDTTGVEMQVRRGTTDAESEMTILYTTTGGEQRTRTFSPGTSYAYVDTADRVATIDGVSQNGSASFTFADDVPTVIFTASSFTPKVRIALGFIPPATTTFTALFKRKCPAWTVDYQEPPLRGSDRVLQTLAHADVLEWRRQRGKAQSKLAEAMQMINDLRDKEVWQEATIRQIVPDIEPSGRDLIAGGILSSKAYF